MDYVEVVKENDQSNLKALLDMGIYKSEEDFLHEALQEILKSNEELRIKLAMHRYQTEDISLGKAAEIAGLCWDDMKQILIKNGIRPRLGPETIEEAREEVLSTRKIIHAMRESRKLRE
jgi:predicted HTH domain antitoxin